jgi:hypothetical protein
MVPTQTSFALAFSGCRNAAALWGEEEQGLKRAAGAFLLSEFGGITAHP